MEGKGVQNVQQSRGQGQDDQWRRDGEQKEWTRLTFCKHQQGCPRSTATRKVIKEKEGTPQQKITSRKERLGKRDLA